MQPYFIPFVTPHVSVAKERFRPDRVGIRLMLASLLALTVWSIWNQPVSAQTPPRSFRIPIIPLEDLESEELPEELHSARAQKLIVDTDPGVDDAAALIWLLSQRSRPVQLLGVVTVAGNTTQENATNNASLILDWLGQQHVPVIPGAERPLQAELSSTGMLIHGPDGLWRLGSSNPQPPPSNPPTATDFYCTQLAGYENEILVLALGPLTNLANAISEPSCTVNWGQVRIVSLGGAKLMGNQTPVTEYNYWQDPEAAIQVLASGAQLTMVTTEGFSQFTIGEGLLKVLERFGVPAIKLLLPALRAYVAVLSSGSDPALPDPVAAMVAVYQGLGVGRPGLVKILGSHDAPEYVRGQTVIAINPAEWLTLAANDARLSELAEIAFVNPEAFLEGIAEIYGNNPPNATVVTDIHAGLMNTIFVLGLTGPHAGVDVPTLSSSEEVSSRDEREMYHLYLPGVEATSPSE